MTVKTKRWTVRVVRAAALIAVLVPVGAALAQEPEAVASAQGGGLIDGWRLLRGLIDTFVFGAVGIALVILGYKVFGWSVPWNLNKEIEQDHNMAAAIVLASMFLGVSIIVAAVIAS